MSTTIDVLFLVQPQSLLLDLAGPAEAFRLTNQQLAGRGQPPRFRLRFVSTSVEQDSSVGLGLAKLEPLPAKLEGPSWVVLVGQPGNGAKVAEQIAEMPGWKPTAAWLERHVRPAVLRDRGHRLITVCSGALLAAAAGLLGTRRCTTHHELLDTLRRMAPQADVVDNRVFVIDGPLASSAGITAGIDLALHLVAQTCGAALAAAVAQVMVVYLRRSALDPELSPLLAHRNHLHPALHRVQDAVCAEPGAPWDIERMASTASVTPRHLSRLFTEHAGVTPLHYLQRIRLEKARMAMQHGTSVTEAAISAGFSSDQQLRRAWARLLPGTPAVKGGGEARPAAR